MFPPKVVNEHEYPFSKRWDMDEPFPGLETILTMTICVVEGSLWDHFVEAESQQ